MPNAKRFCAVCGHTGWVCEAHRDTAWVKPHTDECGGAGMPCLRCNTPPPEEIPDHSKVIGKPQMMSEAAEVSNSKPRTSRDRHAASEKTTPGRRQTRRLRAGS